MTSQNKERVSYLPGQGEQFPMDAFQEITVPSIPNFQQYQERKTTTFIPSAQTLSGLEQKPIEIEKPSKYENKEIISTLRPSIKMPKQTQVSTQPIKPSQPLIIDDLKKPIYESATDTDLELRRDEVMDMLTQNGYIVCGRLYHNKSVEYLLARTNLGDLFFIYIDLLDYRNTFPILTEDNISNIGLNEKNNMILVPQDTIISSLDCLKNAGLACGTAFVCNDNICMTKQKLTNDPTHIQFHCENYILGTNTIVSGNLESSVRSYPIINLSILLNNPNAKIMIEESNKALRMLAIQKNQNKIQHLENTLNEYKKILERAKLLMPSLAPIDNHVNKLSTLWKNTLADKKCYLNVLEAPLASGKESIDSVITSVDALLNPKFIYMIINWC